MMMWETRQYFGNSYQFANCQLLAFNTLGWSYCRLEVFQGNLIILKILAFNLFIFRLMWNEIMQKYILTVYKLDGVAPLITGPPPPISNTSTKKDSEKKSETWQVICDMWQMTCDTRHMTDGGEVNLFSKCQLSRFYGFWVKVSWRFFHKDSAN